MPENNNIFLNRIPTKADITEAHERIKTVINKTPVMTSSYINSVAGAEIFFKCENFQKVGAFKFRGASNSVLSLEDEHLKGGVATHSSGNHAAALALAARTKNIEAYIVMPKTAPEIKKKAVEGYGAKITFCEPTLEAREASLSEIVKKTGALFVHPYDNYTIIAGQATAAKELIEEIIDLDIITAPAGGGGLLSGTSLSVKYFAENCITIGSEPSGADDTFRSIRDNKIYPSVKPNTIADGLLTSLSEKTFKIISENVNEIITVNDDEIKKAMRMVWERMKIIIEPSSAVPLAVIMNSKEKFKGKRVGLIISGGNVDLEKLPF
ncbi:MAG: pyridoxal-phosphate dependent enzyme [Melioribacteraceae bacterium]|nr:pyridoxal-phosphate dependent enzyme [Melioribacteraceae bacterium]